MSTINAPTATTAAATAAAAAAAAAAASRAAPAARCEQEIYNRVVNLNKEAIWTNCYILISHFTSCLSKNVPSIEFETLKKVKNCFSP